MEIYVNGKESERKVYLELPVEPTSMTVNAVKDGEVVHTFNNVTTELEGISVIVPFSLTQTDGELYINWQFSYTEDGQQFDYNQSTRVEIVTPILSKTEIRQIHPAATQDEIVKIEQAVRHVISAHTGQRFGRFVGKKSVLGGGTKTLFLPERLLSLSSVNGSTPGNRYQIGADGFVLHFYPWGVPPVKADYYGLHMHVGGVIHNPNNVKMGVFDSQKTFEIDGAWGWDGVPSPVKEAAKLLINDYSRSDQVYRDRYLTSMTAADWRIQFNGGAFTKTGNVRADQLLSEYILKRGWAVI